MDASVKEFYEDSLQRQNQFMDDCHAKGTEQSDAYRKAYSLSKALEQLLNEDPDADPAEVATSDGRSISSLYAELMELRHARK